jgi:hypothetical protein
VTRAIVSTTALAVTGWILLFGAAGNAVADVPVGPGPTDYTVQPQPAPGTCHLRLFARQPSCSGRGTGRKALRSSRLGVPDVGTCDNAAAATACSVCIHLMSGGDQDPNRAELLAARLLCRMRMDATRRGAS